LAPNFGLGLTKLTLLSQVGITNASRVRECNLEPLNLWTRERLLLSLCS